MPRAYVQPVTHQPRVLTGAGAAQADGAGHARGAARALDADARHRRVPAGGSATATRAGAADKAPLAHRSTLAAGTGVALPADRSLRPRRAVVAGWSLRQHAAGAVERDRRGRPLRVEDAQRRAARARLDGREADPHNASAAGQDRLPCAVIGTHNEVVATRAERRAPGQA